MKKTLALLSILAGGVSAIAAEESAPSFSVTIDVPVVSKYVFRGVEISEESIQPSVEVTAGNAYFGIWGNEAFKSSQRWARELDLYAGYNFAVNDTLKLDAGATYYHYPEATGMDHSFEAYLGANFTFGGFTPAVYIYRDFDLETWTYQGSVGYSIPMENMGTSLDLSATLGWTFPDDGESLTYFSIGASVPFKINDKFKITAGVNYSINDLTFGDDPGVWFSLGATYGF